MLIFFRYNLPVRVPAQYWLRLSLSYTVLKPLDFFLTKKRKSKKGSTQTAGFCPLQKRKSKRGSTGKIPDTVGSVFPNSFKAKVAFDWLPTLPILLFICARIAHFFLPFFLLFPPPFCSSLVKLTFKSTCTPSYLRALYLRAYSLSFLCVNPACRPFSVRFFHTRAFLLHFSFAGCTGLTFFFLPLFLPPLFTCMHPLRFLVFRFFFYCVPIFFPSSTAFSFYL